MFWWLFFYLGGSMLGPQATFPYSPLMGGLPHTTSRPPAPGSFSPFPAQLLYWPYPSPPISPNNYFLPPHGHMSSPSSLLTPTSSISSLSNGVTSPLPSGGPQGQGSPQLPQGPPPNTLVRWSVGYRYTSYLNIGWIRICRVTNFYKRPFCLGCIFLAKSV